MDLQRIKAAAEAQCSVNGYTWMCPTKVLALVAEIERLNGLLNSPEIEDFVKGVMLEAPHQRERWGTEHDAGKAPLDWFWLIGYLAQKAATAQIAGDLVKAKHHTISTAAALANWHAAIIGADTSMRPGIMPPQEQAA
jgi:hypothetical protein